MSSPIDVTIDEIVLDGLDGVDPVRFRRALSGELRRLLERDGAHGPGRSVDRVDSGTLRAPADASAEALARGVAQRVAAEVLP